MKKILGFDLGTTSIGWAFVQEAESNDETSSIVRAGVRVIPLSSDEQNEFETGKDVSTNVARRRYRGMRRNLDRYQLRREKIISLFNEIGFIDQNTILTEDGKYTTHESYSLRAKAVDEQISKEEFVRVLLMISKKRGYKSNRKVKDDEDGNLVDGMKLARKLQDENLTPGQYLAGLDEKQAKSLPEFYRSDLVAEFDRIWRVQSVYYPDIFTQTHKDQLEGKNKNQTAFYFQNTMGIERADPKGTRMEKKMLSFQWRSMAVVQKIELPEIAFIMTELNNEINQASGYLNAISDRSKELIFYGLTVGQYLFSQLQKSKHTSLKNQVFYRQDYMEEFDAIWERQSQYYPELTPELKERIGAKTIFYQRRLKSQKGLISICEFEGEEREIEINGRLKKKLIGPRVAPRSSPIFQIFKIRQNINNLEVSKKSDPKTKYDIEHETKLELFEELNRIERWSDTQFLRWLFKDNKNEDYRDWKLNFPKIEGNRTQSALFEAYRQFLVLEGYDEDLIDTISTNELKEIFQTLSIDDSILDFDPNLPGEEMAEQSHYKLWHLLYSYEADQSKTGNESLVEALGEKFGFSEEQAKIMAKTTFEDDYGNLSVRAMRKILPYLQDGLKYSDAAEMAGYNHSHSVTSEENLERKLLDKLDLLKKNSLRNPVVEKILNQMINVTNAILEDPELGRPDEIRIELTRELKQTQEQRKDVTAAIARATKKYEYLRDRIKKDFGLSYVSRNDLIKYRLYLELEATGFHTPYSNTYVQPAELFTNKFDVDHIIPQSILFDDSFSNKTLELRSVNIEKGNMTALDYCKQKGWENDFRFRVKQLAESPNGINYTKKRRLLMGSEDIPDGFLNRDLGNTAYISKKAKEILLPITRRVTSTTGKITAQLREDWELIDVLKELNWEKYKDVGLTYHVENRHGNRLRRIKDWTKRDDHRHHAMDAITVAFTHPSMIQYLNNMNARSNRSSGIFAIENKYLFKDQYNTRRFKKPFPNIRESAKEHLESILVSFKAKNKVTTINTNRIKVKGGYKIQITHTPRGQLHKETIYAKSKTYVTKLEKVDRNFDQAMIDTVANQAYRLALTKRLEEHDNDPKKAFTGKNSLANNPIFLPNGQEKVPERVKTVNLEDQFTIRKDLNFENFKTLKHIEKVVDVGIRNILKTRLEEYNGDFKAAFSNLDEHPIWLNKERTIPIKTVTITGVSNAEAIHYQKNHHGKNILNAEGEMMPVDYVSTGNNHHVAIYRDEKGDLQEEVVSFYEAVIRKNMGLPIIERNHRKDWEFLFTMKQNEMFIFPDEKTGFDPNNIDLLDPTNRSEISRHLFRVQKFSNRDYWFRHHLETTLNSSSQLSGITFYRFRNTDSLQGIVKVRINHIGQIVQIGEY